MNKGQAVIGGLVLTGLFVATNKSSAANPPIVVPPNPISKEQLLKNYKSAILNVFEEYDKQTTYSPNPAIIDKYADKIIQAGNAQSTIPRLFSQLVESYPDIKIPNSTLTGKQILKDLEMKIYNLYP